MKVKTTPMLSPAIDARLRGLKVRYIAETGDFVSIGTLIETFVSSSTDEEIIAKLKEGK